MVIIVFNLFESPYTTDTEAKQNQNSADNTARPRFTPAPNRNRVGNHSYQQDHTASVSVWRKQRRHKGGLRFGEASTVNTYSQGKGNTIQGKQPQ